MLRDLLHDGTYFELRKGLISIPDINENRTHEVMVKKAKRQFQFFIIKCKGHVVCVLIESAPLEEEHNIQEEIKMMSTVGVHENVVGLLRTCLSECKPLLYNII